MNFAKEQGLKVSDIEASYEGAAQLQKVISDYLKNFNETSAEDVR
jgi:hypothetical protein